MRARWITLVSGATVAAYFLLDRERRTLDAGVRQRLGGLYQDTRHGVTHYAVDGPDDGRLAVLVHGGTVPMFTWDALVPTLTSAGFRALRYDMLGRGYSDRPSATYDRTLYREQLEDLIERVAVSGPIDLVGFSLGGATAANYAARHPERVRRLVLISPLAYGFRAPLAFRTPLLGEVLLRLLGLRILEGRARALFGDDPLSDAHFSRFVEQEQFTGFSSAVLSMFRSDALTDYREAFREVGLHDYPVQLIWGTADTEVTDEAVSIIRRLVPRAEYHPLEGVGHGVVFQRAEAVGSLVADFLSRA